MRAQIVHCPYVSWSPLNLVSIFPGGIAEAYCSGHLAPVALEGLEIHAVAWKWFQEPNLRAASRLKPNDLATSCQMFEDVSNDIGLVLDNYAPKHQRFKTVPRS
ncbi:hypothetical protein DFH06DRAFT_1291968 [Mycena polygramma]|nr:hypothetical protein DFH06DRAFT_1291968 [Mycena polygramma]